eukprot:Partr_v1_DN26687_c2_g1_i1_m69494 putative Vacuolar Protein
MDQIKAEMHDATQSAEAMRADIESLSKRFQRIPTSYKCPLCRLPVMTGPFYSFHCGHAYHRSCLMHHMISNYLTVPMQQRVYTLDAQLKNMALTDDKDENNGRHALQEELDEAIASDCVTCGAIVIKTIDKP